MKVKDAISELQKLNPEALLCALELTTGLQLQLEEVTGFTEGEVYGMQIRNCPDRAKRYDTVTIKTI